MSTKSVNAVWTDVKSQIKNAYDNLWREIAKQNRVWQSILRDLSRSLRWEVVVLWEHIDLKQKYINSFGFEFP